MKNILLGLVLIFVMGFYVTSSVLGAPSATTSAIPTVTLDYTMPFPGILPDHPLYQIKLFRDKILLSFTRDPIKKVNLQLLMSDKQVIMGGLLWEKGKADLAVDTFTKSEKGLLTVVMSLVELKKTSFLPTGLADKVELSAKKHEELISKLQSQVSEETKKKELGKVLEITHQAIQQVATAK